MKITLIFALFLVLLGSRRKNLEVSLFFEPLELVIRLVCYDPVLVQLDRLILELPAETKLKKNVIEKFQYNVYFTSKVEMPSTFSKLNTQYSSCTPLTSICCCRNPAAYNKSVAPNTGDTLSRNAAFEQRILWNFVSSGFPIMLSKYRTRTSIQSLT